MTLENHVVSYELAVKLEELGIRNKSLFWWAESIPHCVTRHLIRDDTIIDPTFKVVRTYLATELLEILPYYQKFGFNSHHLLKITKITCAGLYRGLYCDEIEIVDDHLPNALAKLLIYLVENKLWSPDNDTN